ncbi:GIY-YIG nuclease family protein [uncultured Limnohabitans sp.]|jgi:putative endonuclease|uniref:GIY-YIG nuclease family protein n=1 Tax=uncultured Limnohabitans sp. TaxID=768543 RepID=UPI0026040F37|nr:GIY-YIG nuclease family protein [uncultured Limnohabitans sp.]
MAYFVYILASQKNGTLYVGVTNDLIRRTHEHKQHIVDGFTERYGVTNLVWFDQTDSVQEAIAYEKRLKHWKREWKIALIEKENAHWVDLYESIL